MTLRDIASPAAVMINSAWHPVLDANKLISGFRPNDGRLGLCPSAQDTAPPPTAVTPTLDTNKLDSGVRRNDGRLGVLLAMIP